METKQFIKTIVAYAICFVLCVVAICFAATDKKGDEDSYGELSCEIQNTEQTEVGSATVDGTLGGERL